MAASASVMSGAPPISECAGAVTSRTRDRAGAGGRGRSGCGAGGAGLRGSLGRRGSAWGPSAGKTEPEMGCPGVGARARRRGRWRGAEPVPGPSPSLEGFLEEEAFPLTFFPAAGQHSRGIT